MEQRSKGDEGVSQWERVSASSGRAVRRPRGRAGPVALGGTGEQSGEEARAAPGRTRAAGSWGLKGTHQGLGCDCV